MGNESTAENFESFDDGGDWAQVEESASADSDDWGSPDESQEFSESKPKDEAIKLLDDDNVDADGNKVEKEDKKPKVFKKPKQEAKEEEDSDEESEESSDEESDEIVENEDNTVPEDKKQKSKLRMRMGEDLFNIDSDATFPVKIDGKVENVPVQELINNFSGKTAWDRKFTELGKEKKAVEFEKAQVIQEKQTLTNHITKALEPLKNPEGNPLDSLLYLVEMSGEDPYTAYRRIMEANLTEINGLLDMSETERELYFHKKKDELHGKVAKQRQAKAEKEQSFNQLSQKVEKLRQAYNVSEEDFVDAAEELESSFKDSGLDPESITEEQVVDYASLRTHIAEVKKLVEPYQDNISDGKYGDIVARLSRALRDGELDKNGISKLLKRNFSVDENVKELNTKVYQKEKSKKTSKAVESEGSVDESFDDWD